MTVVLVTVDIEAEQKVVAGRSRCRREPCDCLRHAALRSRLEAHSSTKFRAFIPGGIHLECCLREVEQRRNKETMKIRGKIDFEPDFHKFLLLGAPSVSGSQHQAFTLPFCFA